MQQVHACLIYDCTPRCKTMEDSERTTMCICTGHKNCISSAWDRHNVMTSIEVDNILANTTFHEKAMTEPEMAPQLFQS
jgi:hypothetical protein